MTHAAFSGFDRLASGSLAEVYAACRHDGSALIFDRETGRVVDVDPRFPPSEEGPKPGRPKLGVVAREITLLPRHWDWLATQPGGASVALRKLVEEAMRALYAGHGEDFAAHIEGWPPDVRRVLEEMTAEAF